MSLKSFILLGPTSPQPAFCLPSIPEDKAASRGRRSAPHTLHVHTHLGVPGGATPRLRALGPTLLLRKLSGEGSLALPAASPETSVCGGGFLRLRLRLLSGSNKYVLFQHCFDSSRSLEIPYEP